VTDRANDWLSAGEELPSMTADARWVLREICDILERRIAFAHLIPISGRNLMAVVASHLVLRDAV